MTTPPPVPPEEPTFREALGEWARAILAAVVIWLLLRTFLLEAFRIPSASMENTLLVGDFLFVNKAVYGAEIPWIHYRLPAFREPVRGDILVFDSVEDPDMKVVKRLIGLPGDTLSMAGGQLYRDGLPVDEPFVRHVDISKSESLDGRRKMRQWQLDHFVGRDTAGYHPDLQDWGPVVVPPDSLFLMGDNRDLSYDSRFWGPVPRENVRGSPILIYYSYRAERRSAFPGLSQIRWNRVFTRPK